MAIFAFIIGLMIGGLVGVTVMSLVSVNTIREIDEKFKKDNNKCLMPEGIAIKPDGIHELDPCFYEEVETHYNCMVKVLKCKKCGNVEVEWFRGEEDE